MSASGSRVWSNIVLAMTKLFRMSVEGPIAALAPTSAFEYAACERTTWMKSWRSPCRVPSLPWQIFGVKHLHVFGNCTPKKDVYNRSHLGEEAAHAKRMVEDRVGAQVEPHRMGHDHIAVVRNVVPEIEPG